MVGSYIIFLMSYTPYFTLELDFLLKNIKKRKEFVINKRLTESFICHAELDLNNR